MVYQEVDGQSGRHHYHPNVGQGVKLHGDESIGTALRPIREDLMEKYTTFDNWWTEYVKTSTLNTLHLSFIDVDVLREEMRKAFSRELPMQDAIQPDDTEIHVQIHRECPNCGAM